MTVTAAPDGPLPRWQRSLLPAMLGADHADRGASGASRLPRSAHDWLVDICMFGLAVIVGCGIIASNWHDSSAPLLAVDAAAIAALFTVAVYCVPRHTLQVGLLMVAAAAVYPAVYTQHDHYDLASLLLGVAFTVVAICLGSFVRARAP